MRRVPEVPAAGFRGSDAGAAALELFQPNGPMKGAVHMVLRDPVARLSLV